MTEPAILLFTLLVLLIALAIWAVVGHVLWQMGAWTIRQMLGRGDSESVPTIQSGWACLACDLAQLPYSGFCGCCGRTRPTDAEIELLKDLGATERQLARFLRSNKITTLDFDKLQIEILEAREILTTGKKQPTKTSSEPVQTETPAYSSSIVQTAPSKATAYEPPSFSAAAVAPEREATVIQQPRAPRRSFAEVLNTFMEQSNIRWGEIIGGLLIIGCSTALTVSLWAEISQTPVLKFLIFTTVTAVLFGIGLYTEHRWKLPTTSRGILTIATLLVPLNFLAIAAVSSGTATGALVIGSELLAPAIFLCLVYFAGRVIAPGCAGILSGGILGSSVGQLFVRHFVSAESGPALLVFVGAFPVLCYITTIGLALRKVLADREIDERETGAVFTMLGTMSFAALLPFGLLLYKAGPIGMSMMYLAPIVTLWGLPMLTTGTVLWRMIKGNELAAERTAATALAIIGSLIVLSGMVLAWPNPASIVPTALINVAVFVSLALILELPAAHLIAATCFALAYLVSFYVAAGRSPWLNLRVMSLLEVTMSATSGQALAAVVLVFLGFSDWISHRGKALHGHYWLIASCGIAVISLTFLTIFGVWFNDFFIWPVVALYAAAAYWIALTRKVQPFGWIASALLLFAIAQGLSQSQLVEFSWQTALFIHATVCALVALINNRFHVTRVLSTVLSVSALASSCTTIILMLQANPWQTTATQAQRVFWLAAIWLSLLWLHRSKLLFTAFQIAVTTGVVMGVKATLQRFEWCDYLPHAFLHPWALQIQGTMLVLLSLTWAAIRLRWKETGLINSRFSFDRVLLWSLLPAFWVFVAYGALSGLAREVFARPMGADGINIAAFPHDEVLGVGSWIILALLVLTMLVTLWARREGKYLAGAVIVTCGALPLIAGRFELDIATASAMRWFGAAFFLFGIVASCYWRRLRRFFRGVGWPQMDTNPKRLLTGIRLLLFVMTVVPIIVLTGFQTLFVFDHLEVARPLTGVFSLIDTNFSQSAPLLIVAIALLTLAIRDRNTTCALFAGCVFNAAATVAYLFSVNLTGAIPNHAILIRTVQLNAIISGAYGIVCLLKHKWSRRFDVTTVLNLETQVALALNALLIVPLTLAAILGIWIRSSGPVVGDMFGFASFGVTIAALLLLKHAQGKRLQAAPLALILFAACCLLAVATSKSLQTLTVGTSLISWLMLWLAEHTTNSQRLQMSLAVDSAWQKQCRITAAVLATGGALLSVRLLAEPHVSRWWSVLPLLSASAIFVLINWKTLRREWLYVAGLALNIAATIWWINLAQIADVTFASLIEVNIISLSIASIGWLWLELRSRKAVGTHQPWLSVHNVGAILSLAALIFVVAATFVLAANGLSFDSNPSLIWVTIGSTLSLFIAILWDKHARYSIAATYLLGLLALALGLHQLDLPSTRMAWSAAIGLSIFALTSSLLWRSREKLLDICQRLGIPPRISSDTNQLPWLMAFNAVAVAIVLGIAYWIELRFISFNLRTTVALAVIAQSLTFGLFAQGKWREHWQRASIILFVAGTILMGWAFLTPGVTATWLNRSVILMVETFVLTALYGWGLAKAKAFAPEWTNAARSCMPSIVGAGVIALIFCLVTEVSYQISFGAVRIHTVSLFAIGLTLVIAIVVGVLFAVSPEHDPLSLSEKGRMKYVYAAEVMLALLFLHIRLTLPWLFTGFFEQYWPVVIMSIAYFGIVASEALRRRNLLTVAQPLERTGAFLPLLPVFGFWLAQSEVDYSALLFIVGGLYGLLSILRRSFVFGILAAVAGNGGLWYMLHRTADYGFFEHPQLWLIPVALSVLLAAYLNEDRLDEDQMMGIRYMSLVTVYASSTADIFINGVENSPWLPLILGAFALAGVFSGIIFRIRGLLLLGAVFLLLSIVTMIWYASANMGWTWLWYVAGIVTGATIIFMFAMFEKKRSEVLRVVEGFREWER